MNWIREILFFSQSTEIIAVIIAVEPLKIANIFELEKRDAYAYIGFDPTSNSFHIGNLVQLIILIHFKKCGYNPISVCHEKEKAPFQGPFIYELINFLSESWTSCS